MWQKRLLFIHNCGLHIWKVTSIVLVPFVAIRLIILSCTNRGYLIHFWHRFGFVPTFHADIWIHGVSLGEAQVACQLLDALIKKNSSFANLTYMLSCTTPAGKHVFDSWHKKNTAIEACVVYMPLDVPFAVNLALHKVRPTFFFSIETELWPIFLAKCKKNKTQCFVVNARLSFSSAKAIARVGCLFQQSISSIIFLCQNKATARRYQALGVPKKHTFIFGNIKFDVPASIQPQVIANLQSLGEENHKWIVFGSSRHDEIDLFSHTCIQILKHKPLHTVLWIPRHPHDCRGIAKRLQQYKCPFTTVSAKDLFQHKIPVKATKKVIVIDGFGVLTSCYAVADIVILGGSFGNGGSQNIIEPCALKKCVVCGPSRRNFAYIHQQLHNQGAAIYLDRCEDLSKTILMLSKQDTLRTHTAHKAFSFIQSQSATLPHYVDYFIAKRVYIKPKIQSINGK